MTALEKAEQAIADLTRAEKATLVQHLVRDLAEAFPGIETSDAVCGGEPCIVRTRIPVWVLHEAQRRGLSEADILRSFPILRAEDLANAWAYVRAHRPEIDQQVADNESA
jgi:uncharacterized protein (DUF433 family)